MDGPVPVEAPVAPPPVEPVVSAPETPKVPEFHPDRGTTVNALNDTLKEYFIYGEMLDSKKKQGGDLNDEQKADLFDYKATRTAREKIVGSDQAVSDTLPSYKTTIDDIEDPDTHQHFANTQEGIPINGALKFLQERITACKETNDPRLSDYEQKLQILEAASDNYGKRYDSANNSQDKARTAWEAHNGVYKNEMMTTGNDKTDWDEAQKILSRRVYLNVPDAQTSDVITPPVEITTTPPTAEIPTTNDTPTATQTPVSTNFPQTEAHVDTIAQSFPAQSQTFEKTTANTAPIQENFPVVSGSGLLETENQKAEKKATVLKNTNFFKKAVANLTHVLPWLPVIGNPALGLPPHEIQPPPAITITQETQPEKPQFGLIDIDPIPSPDLANHSVWGVFNHNLVTHVDWNQMQSITGKEVPEELKTIAQTLKTQELSSGKNVDATDPEFNKAVVLAEDYLQKAIDERSALDMIVNYKTAIKRLNPDKPEIFIDEKMIDDTRFFKEGDQVAEGQFNPTATDVKLPKLESIIKDYVTVQKTQQPNPTSPTV